MMQCREIDGLMMDWLYDELDPDSSSRVKAHLDGCARCAAEAGALRRTREAFRELEPEEPPPAVSAILQHEAARRVAAPAARAEAASSRDEGSFLERVRSWLRPLWAHPAAAAAATLVFVVGVAGALWVRKGADLADTGAHTAPSAAPPPAEAPAAAAATGAAPGPGAAKGGKQAAAGQGDLLRDQEAKEQEQPQRTAGLLDEVRQAEIERQQAEAARSVEGTARIARSRGDGHAEPPTGEQPRPKAARRAQRQKQAEAPEQKGEIAAGVPRSLGSAPPPNAVSGADPRIESDLPARSSSPTSTDSGGAPAGRAPTGAAGRGRYAEPPPAASGGAFARSDDAERAERAAPLTAAQLRAQEKRLSAAVKAGRCSEVASIANDILDRNPDYYRKNLASSKGIKSCGAQVARERQRRVTARLQGGGGGKSGKATSAPEKAKAAPQPESAR